MLVVLLFCFLFIKLYPLTIHHKQKITALNQCCLHNSDNIFYFTATDSGTTFSVVFFIIILRLNLLTMNTAIQKHGISKIFYVFC